MALGQGQGGSRQVESPLTPEDPPAVGHYQLISRLGAGGMGTVYLAQAPDGAKVALKAIRRDFAADPVYRARFHEEVSNAQRVASFCTARVLDHGDDGGLLYLVTEFIDGVSLEDHLIEHGALPPSVLHSAAVGVAAALTAIHAAGLVHRDLKPANVMLTLAGPRVIDFGLARSTHLNSRHTNAGMVMGTPGWIAPEQVFEGRTSPAADVFAWGSLIAYAGLGGHPFGEGDAYVMAARARQAPPDLRGLPAPLDRLVAAAVHPDPARRPQARELLLELVGAPDGSGDSPAQLAATKHLTNVWNPADVPPLAAFPHGPGGRQGAPGWTPPPAPGQAFPPSPSGQRPPSPSRQGPPTSSGQAPPGSSGQRPPGATGRGPLPPPPTAPPPTAARPSHAGGAPPAETTGQRPLPPRPTGQGPAGPPHATRQGPLPPHPTGQGRLPTHATGQGPLPPRATMPRPPFAPRPRGRGFSGCLIAVAVAVILILLMLAVLIWINRPADLGADGPVQDGRLKFTVTGVKCAKAAQSASTRSCRVSVKVNNVGPEGRVLYPGQQKLLDEDDALYSAAKLLDKQGAESPPIRLNPGQAFTGALLFQLPKDASPAALELHDSGLSRGVRVALP